MGIYMKNILLPTDFSDNSWNAIQYAFRFYENTACTFYILHVSEINNLIANENGYVATQDVIENVLLKPAKEQLDALVKRIKKELPIHKNHKVFTLTDYSLFIDSIRKHVKSKGIDMIIMGTKGASGLKELIIGSNAGGVITKVPCTTMVIPENAKYKALKEVAFPTDFFLSYDTRTLDPISQILEKENATLSIVHINKPKTELNIDQQNNKDLLSDLFSGYNYNFYELTNRRVEDAVQCFVESRKIDLISMVAKNLNYFQGILFHTKVEKISYHINIPFLVLHE